MPIHLKLPWMANNSSLAVIKKKKREEKRNSLTTYRKGIIAEKMPVFLVYIRALSSLIEVRSGRVFFICRFLTFLASNHFPPPSLEVFPSPGNSIRLLRHMHARAHPLRIQSVRTPCFFFISFSAHIFDTFYTCAFIHVLYNTII